MPELFGGMCGGQGHNAYSRCARGDDAGGRVLEDDASSRRRGESRGSQGVALGVGLTAVDRLGAGEDAWLR